VVPRSVVGLGPDRARVGRCGRWDPVVDEVFGEGVPVQLLVLALAAVEDADYEPRMNAKALAWLEGPHRIALDVAEELRAMVGS
jgi:hypothetical protein